MKGTYKTNNRTITVAIIHININLLDKSPCIVNGSRNVLLKIKLLRQIFKFLNIIFIYYFIIRIKM